MNIKLYLPIILAINLTLSIIAMEQQGASQHSNETYKKFFDAANRGQKNLIVELINTGIDVNTKNQDKKNRTALMLATHSKKAIKTLLKHNADPNIQDSDGDTALTIAAAWKQSKVVEKLLKHGANVNLKNDLGKSPLWIAASNGDHVIVEILLKNGADINARALGDQTPLMEAAKRNHIRIIKALLGSSKGKFIEVFATNTDGQTAFKIASSKKHMQIAELLRKVMKKRGEDMTRYNRK